jgi:hypothetical protein
MMNSVLDLVATIEDEVQVGEQLLDNLSAQRKAILAWNASTLLERLTEKELLLYKLEALATRQQALMGFPGYPSAEQQGSLSVLIEQLPAGPERTVLSDLQSRVWEIYKRLRAEEQKLVSLLENLLGHMQAVLASLAQAPVHVYGRNGTPAALRPESELIQGKV